MNTRAALGTATAILVGFVFWNPTAMPKGKSHGSRVEPGHFHHVHLNVTDPAETIQFYRRFFGANSVSYRGVSDALFTEKSFILLNTVGAPAPSHLTTSLWHIGWAGVDGPSEFEWRANAGIEVQTPLTPLGSNHYMYFWGPDREVIEVFTGSKNHRFEHVHLLSSDVERTIRWFVDHVGLTPRGPTLRWEGSGSTLAGGFLWNLIRVDNVNLIVFEAPGPGDPRPAWLPDEVGDEFVPTDGTAIDHIAFSYADLTPVYERMRGAGVEIVAPIATDPEKGLTSFFVRAPDQLLVEIVQEKPVPEGIWN